MVYTVDDIIPMMLDTLNLKGHHTGFLKPWYRRTDSIMCSWVAQPGESWLLGTQGEVSCFLVAGKEFPHHSNQEGLGSLYLIFKAMLP